MQRPSKGSCEELGMLSQGTSALITAAGRHYGDYQFGLLGALVVGTAWVACVLNTCSRDPRVWSCNPRPVDELTFENRIEEKKRIEV